MSAPAIAAIAAATALALAQQPCNDLSGLTAAAQDAITQLNLRGMVLRLDQHGQSVYSQTFGSHTPNQVMALASASKTLSAAVLMSLVDQQRLRLDDTVGTYLPEYSTGPKAAITLRMCFTHTSGLPPLDPAASDPTITMRQAAQQIALLPLGFAPGTRFSYGEVSMQVAGAVCEVVSGLPWSQLFQQQIGNPLGMTSTHYLVYGPTLNPNVADGAASNAPDYLRFLEMLRQGGVYNNVRVLSQASVDEMLTDQMSWLPNYGTPHPNNVPCGIGCWLERQDALRRTTLVSMPGLFGFYGWLDRDHDSAGVWLANSFYALSFPYVERCWGVAAGALAPLGVDCSGSTSPPCAAMPQLNATTWARAGQRDFGFAVSDAPPQAIGGLVLGFGPATAGVPFFDLISYVPGLQLGFVPLATDGLGAGRIGTPLPHIQGATLTLQGFWLDVPACGSSGLRASRALQLDVLP